jgi:glucoamylase
VLYNLSLGCSGRGVNGETSGGRVQASDGPVASALAASAGFAAASNGYSATASDGVQDLVAHHWLATQYDSADFPPEIWSRPRKSAVGTDTTFALALAIGFGTSRIEASACRREWPGDTERTPSRP